MVGGMARFKNAGQAMGLGPVLAGKATGGGGDDNAAQYTAALDRMPVGGPTAINSGLLFLCGSLLGGADLDTAAIIVKLQDANEDASSPDTADSGDWADVSSIDQLGTMTLTDPATGGFNGYTASNSIAVNMTGLKRFVRLKITANPINTAIAAFGAGIVYAKNPAP